MNPFGNSSDPTEDAEPKPQPWDFPEQQKKLKPRRKPPKSAAEQLIELQAREETLREQVEKQRLKRRVELVEDLFKKYRVAQVQGDLDESRRLANLRQELEL